MFQCEGKNLQMQHLQGPETNELDKWEYAWFKCSDCNLNCYRKRQVGKIFNSEWKEYIATGWDELRTLDQMTPYNESVCAHPKAQLNPVENTSTKKIVKVVCSECNMNCKFEQLIGYFWNSVWKRVG